MANMALSKADICAKLITPALLRSGDEVAQICREISFSEGRIIGRGQLVCGGEDKRADYILFYKLNTSIALIEVNHALNDSPKRLLGYCEIRVCCSSGINESPTRGAREMLMDLEKPDAAVPDAGAAGLLQGSEVIEFKQQSLSWPEQYWRWTSRYAIRFDGFHGTTRELYLPDSSSKDFLVSRAIEICRTEPSEVRDEENADWNEYVALEIGPRPELSHIQTESNCTRLRNARRQGRNRGSVGAFLIRPKAPRALRRSRCRESARSANRASEQRVYL